MSILIKGALLDGAVTDVYIEKKEIRAGRDGSSGTGGSGDRRKA